MAPRPHWKGYLKLSLVSCPIALYPAIAASERISFRQVNKQTGNRLRQQLVDSVTGDVVQSSDKPRAAGDVKKNCGAAPRASSRKVQSFQTNSGFYGTELHTTSPSDRAVVDPMSCPIARVMLSACQHARAGCAHHYDPVSPGVARRHAGARKHQDYR